MVKILVPYIRKDLIIQNTHVKHHCSSTRCSKVISKVTVFKKWVKHQSRGQRVKYNGTHGKDLSQGIVMWIIKALSLTVQRLLARLKSQRGVHNTEWQNYRMSVLQIDRTIKNMLLRFRCVIHIILIF